MDDERVLLSLARALDEAALGHIFDTYYPVLCRYCNLDKDDYTAIANSVQPASQ